MVLLQSMKTGQPACQSEEPKKKKENQKNLEAGDRGDPFVQEQELRSSRQGPWPDVLLRQSIPLGPRPARVSPYMVTYAANPQEVPRGT